MHQFFVRDRTEPVCIKTYGDPYNRMMDSVLHRASLWIGNVQNHYDVKAG